MPARLRRLSACLLLGLLLAGAVQAETSVRPGINDHYRDARWGQWIGVFESTGREIYDRRFDILSALELREGMVIADVGAGTGFFTRLFAQAVGPTGHVYAVDIAPDFVSNIERLARQDGLDNVTGIVNSDRDAMLPAASVDLVFLSDTYHHFEYPQSMLASIRQALRHDGELVVIDFRKQAGRSSEWVMEHVRAARPQVIEEIETAGFRLTQQYDFLRSNYYLRFARAARR
jgi:predicted methyltransferase